MSADFIDSNVFVYLFDETEGRKQARARTIVSEAAATHTGVISFQVVQEVLNVVSAKMARPLRPADTQQLLDAVLVPLWKVNPTPALYGRALDLHARYRYGFYDSLIIAAALEAGCTRLLSEDLQHGQRIEDLVIEDPFRS